MESATGIERTATAGQGWPRTVVIGAGMSGVLMGHRLREAGLGNFTIYEKGESVGGTWRENHYPGLHCDVPSHHYCYSFAPNPGWSREYSPGPEIWRYFDRTSRQLGITRQIRFNTAVTEARWDGAGWQLRLSDGTTDVADILVSATGVLHVPMYPNIQGLDDFGGVKFHTTKWDHSVPLADKRIGIIGTGSTAVQIVAELSGKVRELVLFQRTAQWVAKTPNRHFPLWKRLLFRLFPSIPRRLYKEAMSITTAVVGSIIGEDPAGRAALVKNVEDNLASVKDPVLRAKLTPNHEVGCKRLISSPNFYEAIQHPQSRVVTETIDHVEQRGIVTKDGRLHELDILVLATGFDPTAYVRPVKLYGPDGHDLDSLWAERPIAYRSIAVPHMPNFFMIGGPFCPFHSMSLVLMSECLVDYIMKCIRVIAERRVAMAPHAAATAEMIKTYREAAKHTIYATGGCASYYLDSEGVPFIYPYGPQRFRDDIRQDPVLNDYHITPLPAFAAR